ncbi:MAG: pyridoxine 5'-phosphate synthase [Candidatus Magnetoovum sp. WYHC-5]|nr:pyridoxine 5'-phosphate synthase [Candidatus Magnetoovum sp. WYHC-5]
MILSVNIDHVATLRQARLGIEPEPVMAATLAILGGADGITVHLREDRRHIQDRDLRILKDIVYVDLNLEMAATDEMVTIALNIKPEMVTIVPEKRQELTTEGGLDIYNNKEQIRTAIKRLKDGGIPVSLFVAPQTRDIELSKEVDTDMVELHTGVYANDKKTQATELRRIRDAVKLAQTMDMEANAGHGLNYNNVAAIADIKHIKGLYIGHSIVSRAVLVGMEKAVRQMKEIITA